MDIILRIITEGWEMVIEDDFLPVTLLQMMIFTPGTLFSGPLVV